MLYLVGRATACVKLCLLLADPAIEEWATGTLDLNWLRMRLLFVVRWDGVAVVEW